MLSILKEIDLRNEVMKNSLAHIVENVIKMLLMISS